MTHTTIAIVISVIFSVLAVVYFLLRRAIYKHDIVRIDCGGESHVEVNEKEQPWTPTILGIAIVVAIIALTCLTSFDCISYTR
jgi:UDP-N-acetylmuramyl pentapeptide phosphotransferase/UDP-N-acetylglucosamine-1-phosphate transferase